MARLSTSARRQFAGGRARRIMKALIAGEMTSLPRSFSVSACHEGNGRRFFPRGWHCVASALAFGCVDRCGMRE